MSGPDPNPPEESHITSLGNTRYLYYSCSVHSPVGVFSAGPTLNRPTLFRSCSHLSHTSLSLVEHQPQVYRAHYGNKTKHYGLERKAIVNRNNTGNSDAQTISREYRAADMVTEVVNEKEEQSARIPNLAPPSPTYKLNLAVGPRSWKLFSLNR